MGDELKQRLSRLSRAEREAVAEAALQEKVATDPTWVQRRLAETFARLSAEGVYDGMTEAEVRKGMRDLARDLGLSPDRGLN